CRLGAAGSLTATEPGKGDHPLLAQLVAVVQRRHPFTAQYRRLTRQRHWLVELERRLDPPEDSQPRPTPRTVKRQVKDFLAYLEAYALQHPTEAKVVAHISTTFRQR